MSALREFVRIVAHNYLNEIGTYLSVTLEMTCVGHRTTLRIYAKGLIEHLMSNKKNSSGRANECCEGSTARIDSKVNSFGCMCRCASGEKTYISWNLDEV